MKKAPLVPDTALRRWVEHLVHWRVRRRMAGHQYFHDLQSVSGFADRIYDVWSAVTLARLLDPDASVAVRWHWRHGRQARRRNYSTKLFGLAGCEFVAVHPPGALRMPHRFDLTLINEQLLVPLPSGNRQLILRHGDAWGHGQSDQVVRDLALYGLDDRPGAGLDRQAVVQAYNRVARSLTPSPAVAAQLPADLSRRVGVHVRLTDKLVEAEQARDMDLASWHRIEAWGRALIDDCVATGQPLFICSDDLAYRARLLADIRAQGGDAVAVELPDPSRRPAGFAALVDFFALSRCARIVQMTRYSNFTTAAALVGDKPVECMDFAGSD